MLPGLGTTPGPLVPRYHVYDMMLCIQHSFVAYKKFPYFPQIPQNFLISIRASAEKGEYNDNNNIYLFNVEQKQIATEKQKKLLHSFHSINSTPPKATCTLL